MAEKKRLQEDKTRERNWKRWGPYLSERQWGTVREDYSPDGSCWDYFPHEHARSRAYRWGEDGLLGITDRECRLCSCLGLWNGRDSILKERLFGLTGPQGNHGEDVKELYYYLDSTPTHSYMKALYKYTQDKYPYERLVDENRERGITQPELEIEDTGAFNENRYWDVFAEYAKCSPNDVLCRHTVHNRGPDTATIHVLIQFWFRNTWIWGCTHEGCTMKPKMTQFQDGRVQCKHESLGVSFIDFDVGPEGEKPEVIFTENETNSVELFSVESYTPYVRDAFHKYVIKGDVQAVNTKDLKGTKVAAVYKLTVPSGGQAEVRARFFSRDEVPTESFGKSFNNVFSERIQEANEFYSGIIKNPGSNEKQIARQAYAGLLWSKQFYHYIVKDWLNGDMDQPTPPQERLQGRNADWPHLFNRDIISMPDKWEYPWYASWDLAFHMVPFAHIDIEFAKEQLLLFLREWFMHPNGQIPAYEFAFGDVNPPVHAFAVIQVWRQTGPRGARDMQFLARCFQKLILNFTWWVNRKDPDGKNIFAGGFLGLDNIGVFDRSRPLPTGGELRQADGTAWMAFFAVIMLDIALELAEFDPVYEDMASKFFEHFVAIADAMNNVGDQGLWNDKDGFYYDHLSINGISQPLHIRSMVGLVPLFSVLALDLKKLQKFPGFTKRTHWFIDNRKDLSKRISFLNPEEETTKKFLLAIPRRDQLERVLHYLLDEEEFLSPFGVRSLSKFHEKSPFVFHAQGQEYRVEYLPAESNTHMFGGNSNWRGPIWLCMNYLIVESLKRYHFYYGDDLMVDCPTGSGKSMNLKDVAAELEGRIIKLFVPDKTGKRPCNGEFEKYKDDPHWKDLILFYEFFHGDTGRGCGASHQTGWTALVASCLQNCAAAHVQT